ncbi:MAG: terpene cyclase/mutase family protein [Verrucomicrobia bacterium]|mgnify:CR=1 FL=1|jgi:squalene-hopene/tetraprenyl-beta-curcumene cyclase|nr:terpene cyclase/mutase family protein [Verrucomicrobiota bacterium]
MTSKAIVSLLLVAGALFTSPTHAQQETSILPASDSASGLGVSLELEIQAAIDRALDWFAANQKEDGSWSNGSYPALTALPTWAFTRAEHSAAGTVVPKAVAFMKRCIQDDGGIYCKVAGRKGGGLGNYNTAICMTALHSTGDRSLTRTIQNARTFVAKGQHRGDDVYKGGFGYDKNTDRAYADLMNTLYAAEAMRLTQDVEDVRPANEAKANLDWQAAAKFVEKMQNKSSAGEQDAGGFFYKPGESKAGTTTNETGVLVFRSYGSMTYAGLLALIYADVDRDDPRVRSAFDWACKNWDLKENPGMGAEGLFFFYNVLSRSLSAYGAEVVPRADGTYTNWRKAVAQKILSSQTIDPTTGHGYWVNADGRFWERDPALVTAYSVLALEHALGQ